MDPKQSITKNCETVWTYHLSPLLDPSEKPEEAQKNFLEKCTTQGAKECEDKGEDAKVMACLLNLAQKEAWAKFITPKSVRNVPAPAVEAPKDATPIDAPSILPATPQSEEPTGLTLKQRFTFQAGAGFNFTETGFSRNDEAVVVPHSIGGYLSAKVGGLFTPTTLANRWAYTTAIAIQGDYLSLSSKSASSKISVWGLGPTISGLFVYEFVGRGLRLMFGPEISALVGALSTSGCIDVGVPGKCYEATGQRIVGNIKAGATIGIEMHSDPGNPSYTVLLNSGVRYLIHGEQVQYTADLVQLKGATWDAINLFFGINY